MAAAQPRGLFDAVLPPPPIRRHVLHPAPAEMVRLITICGSLQTYLDMLMSAMTTAEPERWGWLFNLPGTCQSVVICVEETVFVNPYPNGLPVYHHQVAEGAPRMPPQRNLQGQNIAG